MKGRCFDMSAVAQSLKKPFRTPWSPPENEEKHMHRMWKVFCVMASPQVRLQVYFCVKHVTTVIVCWV